MKAILYLVLTMDDQKDKKRQKQLTEFLEKYEIEVVSTYYDVNHYGVYNERKGLNRLLDDLNHDLIQAEAFICLSVKDIGKRKILINTLAQINSFVPMIYFTDIESSSNSDDIA